MSYVVQHLQNWLISWFFNWFKMVSVRFLERKCFIQPLLSSEFSIDLCFDDILEQHGVGLKKVEETTLAYSHWILRLNCVCDKHFPITGRISKKQAQMCLAQSFIGSDRKLNCTRLFAELFYFMLQVPSQAINTRDLTLLLALMKFRAWLAKFCLVNPSLLARNIKRAHACGFIYYLHSGIVDN